MGRNYSKIGIFIPSVLDYSNYTRVSRLLIQLYALFSRITLQECDTNIRLLSWLLIGSLSHTVNFPDAYIKSCPIKIDESSHVAEFVLIILAKFADNSQVGIWALKKIRWIISMVIYSM